MSTRNRTECQNEGDESGTRGSPKEQLATLPPASRSPMNSEPTTAATRNAVPTNSDAMRVSRVFTIGDQCRRSASLSQVCRGWTRKTQEQTDSAFKSYVRIAKRFLDLLLYACDSNGVRHAPVCGHWRPGQTGQTSLAALSQTVKTTSNSGAPGFANSSQFLLRRLCVGTFAISSCRRA